MKKLLTMLIVLSIPFVALADVQKIDSLTPIELEIGKIPDGTLILLDIGGTLMSYPDAVLHSAHESWKRDWFQKHCPQLSKEEKTTLVRIVEGDMKNWRLLDTKWPQLIQKMQDQGAKVVAFTKVAMDPSLKGTRAAKIRALGLSIKNDLPELSSGQHYEYAEGVIETEAAVKGPVLREVLSRLPEKPKMILFVDDRIEQISSVHETCRELKIPCIAYHYVPFTRPPLLDEKVAHYQLTTLLKEKRWVSEHDALVELEMRTGHNDGAQ